MLIYILEYRNNNPLKTLTKIMKHVLFFLFFVLLLLLYISTFRAWTMMSVKILFFKMNLSHIPQR